MENLLAQYPYVEQPKSSTQETRPDRPASLAQPISVEPSTKYGNGPSASVSSSTAGDGWTYSPRLPYSPSKTELESHPIRQRLSLQGDEETIGLGSAPEIPIQTTSWTQPAAQELAQEVDRIDAVDMADTSIKEGDSVSFGWGGDKKGGTVTEVKTSGQVEMETARGNTATKEGSKDDPAIRLERAGHDVVKNASEVQKDEPGEQHNEGGVQKEAAPSGGVQKPGEKRAAEPKENGEEPKKKKGRPAKNGTGAGVKKETKKRTPKRAATESGEPRRSGRNANKSS